VRVKRHAVVALTIGVALAATTASASSAPRVSCSVVSKDIIASALDQRLAFARSTPLGANGTNCGYFGKTGGFPLVRVYYRTGVESPTKFAREYGSQARDHRVTGVGDRAYYFIGGSGLVVLNVLSGSTVIQIEAPSRLERIEALAKRIAPLTRS
jgi:hypothetical protein